MEDISVINNINDIDKMNYIAKINDMSKMSDMAKMNDMTKMHEMHSMHDMDNMDMMDCLEKLPLAMAYVPMQQWRQLYEPEVGIVRGTIFAELDKPFIGERMVLNGK